MSIKSSNALTFIGRSLHTVLLSALPERWIYARTLRAMEHFLHVDDLQTKLCFTASGRAALSMLFRYLHGHATAPVDTILLPDYICNVVSAASEYANLRICYYKTKNYAPCMESVKRLLETCNHACILFASIMGYHCEHEALYTAVRACYPDMPIIFDECQHMIGLRTALPVLARKDTYCVISFNNKMTQGLLGGAVYGLPHQKWTFEPQSCVARSKTQLNMVLSYIRQNVKLLYEYSTGKHHLPEEQEKSTCEGKYCVVPRRIYKISLAAAYLGLRHWKLHENTLVQNGQLLLSADHRIQQAGQMQNSIPLYIPVIREDALIGKYPLKGRYWTSVPCPQYQDHMYIVVPNTLKVRSR